MADFFTGSGPGRPGLALFVNAGDPPLDALPDLALALDEQGADCLELAVPFPDSVTDGPVIRRSARRALERGTGLDEVLECLAGFRPRLRRLRVALLVDWSHTLKRRDHAAALGEIAAAGADGVLVHALPPRLRETHLAAAGHAGLPVVSTCYQNSPDRVRARAAADASGYLYLVAHYGRSGTAPAAGHGALAGTVAGLRSLTSSPIAVGFGVRTRQDVQAVAACGADAAVIGSAGVARIESALEEGRDPVRALGAFVRSVQPVRSLAPTPNRS
ncbi:tryptophan synthase subunit alpha [Streptomyces sp. NRRL S-1868]|uniref:tryptophan synthase subunit alpha n=1 Tax=Streptomyces sp. NRRL S-1868 TaxID=1463892 RepID=UPI0004C50339|nr:tryptophan synthase subunit alpha [Streptomyces sp. NRRL S-1868]